MSSRLYFSDSLHNSHNNLRQQLEILFVWKCTKEGAAYLIFSYSSQEKSIILSYLEKKNIP